LEDFREGNWNLKLATASPHREPFSSVLKNPARLKEEDCEDAKAGGTP
jgi:hypothetical protein